MRDRRDSMTELNKMIRYYRSSKVSVNLLLLIFLSLSVIPLKPSMAEVYLSNISTSQPEQEVLVDSPCYGILPKFGRGLLFLSSTGVSKVSECRDVESRLIDYRHTCLIRSEVKEVSKESINKWKVNRFHRRNLNKYDKKIQQDCLRELVRLKNLTAEVAAEAYRYDIKLRMNSCIDKINLFYSEGFVRKWESLPKYPKYKVEFDGIFDQIKDELHRRLDVLDRVHIVEFELWKDKNPEKYEQLRNERDERIRQLVTQLKVEANNQRMASLKAQVEAAEAKAVEASRRATEAEERAAEAEDSAREAWDEVNWMRNNPPPPPKFPRRRFK